MRNIDKYKDQIYAGVLGKMIGVYLGRPVEGWPYQSIIDRFGEVPYYVNEELGLPLIVADDDLSGTFAFFRAMEDHNYRADLSAKEIGQTWLNYIIENKTILWWGGLGNSTEHTAYLHLKHGIDAPLTGSMELNGPVLSQQIGAQIFMDAYAMMFPGDPERANHYVRECARVSHDGIAVDAAGFLGSLEAAAFDTKDLDILFNECSKFIETDALRYLVDDVRNISAQHSDWRIVREKLDEKYGYHIYPGPCHMVPNHAMVLASILIAKDDFAESVKIAASAAWDTDCNAGNVGCFNGIRLGMDGINSGPDFRKPMADRMYVITSDGGEGITDAVKETDRIVRAAKAFNKKAFATYDPRFSFSYPGSVQGFEPCPYVKYVKNTPIVKNANEYAEGNGLHIQLDGLGEGTNAFVSTPTFLNLHEEYANYETYVSPTLYSGQTVSIKIKCDDVDGPLVRPYVWYADRNNDLQRLKGGFVASSEVSTISWEIPDNAGLPILRIGLEFSSIKRFTGAVIVQSIDWANTPRRLAQTGIMMRDMWDLNPFWAKMFVSSAKNFNPNLNYTYCISHDEKGGVATIGTRDFTNYQVSSTIKLSLHERAGLVARSRGHRRFYSATLRNGNEFSITKHWDGVETTLASSHYEYEQFVALDMTFSVYDGHLEASVGDMTLTCDDHDNPIMGGSAGYMVDGGSMFIDGFVLERID